MKIEIDALAQEIRRVDGSHSLGAGALAEALMPFLTAGLAVQTQQGVEVKKLAFNNDPCPAAVCAFGHYVINPIYSHVELFVGYGRMSMTGLGRVQLGHGASVNDLRAAAQSDYETRIRSALVDVPAVESEPVAWMDDGTCRAGSDRTAYRVVTAEQKRDMPSAVSSSFNIPLYAHHPRSLSNEGSEVDRLRRALIAIAHTFTEDSHGGTKSLPASEYQDMARAALSTRKGSAEGDGSASTSKGCSE